MRALDQRSVLRTGVGIGTRDVAAVIFSYYLGVTVMMVFVTFVSKPSKDCIVIRQGTDVVTLIRSHERRKKEWSLPQTTSTLFTFERLRKRKRYKV